MREDLAFQISNISSNNNNKKKIMSIENLVNWNNSDETDSNVIKDGMENIDDEVCIIKFYLNLNILKLLFIYYRL